ncbi:BACON domain-containing protein (plasmid) [Pedobacter sp. BS3]|uniref:BACON domain-containing protein n=1 Tax=Pedobacter sp. BS3 TaxID=2567937 RepID=UPI0011EBB47C|nr:BACON domain-containing protein [Pedobacter sp. BS3]TZF86248.1 BACON domain-containing protein [Pedobacter sp. BS3]
MKKIINLSIASLLLTFFSCSKEHLEPFLKQDPEKLMFDYKGAKRMFTLKTNEAWSVDLGGADWITVDKMNGQGDKDQSQVITITVERNTGDEREAALKIITATQQSVMMVEQERGKITFGTPSFTEPLMPTYSLDGIYLVLPYSRGGVPDPVLVTTRVSGTGSEGVVVADVQADLTEETGTIRIPLSGVPAKKGEIQFTLSLLGEEVVVNAVVEGNDDPVGMVYLSQDFNLLEFGGDQIANTPGIALVAWDKLDDNGVLKDMLPANPQYKTVVSYADGSQDYFRFVHPAYLALRGLTGWTGLDVYERPGHIKLNTSARNGGYITTPALSQIQGKVAVKVTFSMAKANNNDTYVIVDVLGAGTFDDGSTSKELNPLYLQWDNRELVVEGATSATSIRFSAKNNVVNPVFLLDNIQVLKER